MEELPDAIEALQNGDDIDYQGVSGDLELDDAGDPRSGVYDVFAFGTDELEKTSEVPFDEGKIGRHRTRRSSGNPPIRSARS